MTLSYYSMARVIIVHRWEGSLEMDWYPWLKKTLEEKKIDVVVPAMPHPEKPVIDAWVHHLKDVAGDVNEETYFVGHSIGCQTIMRYLENLPYDVKVGGVVFVGGWIHLKPKALEDDVNNVAVPWLRTPLDWDKIKARIRHCVVVFSDNDPYVSVDDAYLFKNKLDAQIVKKEGQGHFTQHDGVTEMPVIVEELLHMMGSSER
jgi:uncharacterized protein